METFPRCFTRIKHFNKKHAKARNVVEMTIGVLKCRFRCILGERKHRYHPSKATMYAVLYTIFVSSITLMILNDVVVPLEPVEENFSGSVVERRRRQIANTL